MRHEPRAAKRPCCGRRPVAQARRLCHLRARLCHLVSRSVDNSLRRLLRVLLSQQEREQVVELIGRQDFANVRRH